MANKTITQLISGAPASALADADGFEIVQGGTSKGGIFSQLKTYILAVFGANGIVARTAAGTFSARTITGTATEITVTNGDGVSGNPTLSLPSSLSFTGKGITGGSYVSAAFNGTLGVTTPSTVAATTIAASGLISANGGQIAFPASQNASAGANTFDDYEEGTATIGVSFGGASVGVTYTTQILHYTKLGNRVCFELDLVLSAKGSSTGAALITGLPFAAAAGVNSSVAIESTAGFTGLVAGISGRILASSTTIAMRGPHTTGSTALADTNFSNTSTLFAAGSYHV